jgi:hypothetical protein
MNLQDDPEALFRTAAPEPPPTDFDLDRIVRDGYRVRRRQRAMVGGAAATGVAAVVAVLALTVVGLPGGDAEPDLPPTEGGEQPELLGYPFGGEAWGAPEERARLEESATAAFKELTIESGLRVEDDYIGDNGSEPPFLFGSKESPGNYGQTWLRSYYAEVVGQRESGEIEPVLQLESLLPGGWTPEPGPVTEQLFPQHVISASGSPWAEDADWTDELETTDLDGGRTLTTVHHECAFEALVTYPNGTGLHAVWDMGCGEGSPTYGVELDDFAAAVAAMPEMEYDTSELTPVGDLVDVPTGWLVDPEWEATAQESAKASADAAREVIEAAVPGASLGEGMAEAIGGSDPRAVARRIYSATGVAAFTPGDGALADETFGLRYTLPGGWLPGMSEPGTRGAELQFCIGDSICESSTDEDGTIWVVEAFEETEGGPVYQLAVTRFDPDGWAVLLSVSAAQETSIDVASLQEEVKGILRQMPAPVYDASATPQIPEE